MKKYLLDAQELLSSAELQEVKAGAGTPTTQPVCTFCSTSCLGGCSKCTTCETCMVGSSCTGCSVTAIFVV